MVSMLNEIDRQYMLLIYVDIMTYSFITFPIDLDTINLLTQLMDQILVTNPYIQQINKQTTFGIHTFLLSIESHQLNHVYSSSERRRKTPRQNDKCDTYPTQLIWAEYKKTQRSKRILTKASAVSMIREAVR